MGNKLRTYGGNVLLISVVTLLSSTAAGIITPLWPIYIKTLGASMTELGFIFSATSAMSAILQIPSGLLSDKYGRRKIHALGIFLGIFPPLLYTFSKNWTDLIPWAILSGMSTGLYLSVRWSMIADASTTQTRATVYSWMNVAMLAGSTIAPILGGFLADLFDVRFPFVISFLLFCSCFPLTLFIHETRGGPTIRIDEPQGKKLLITFSTIVIIYSIVNILQGIGMGITMPLTPIFVTEGFHVDLTLVGILQAVGFGLASLVAQIPGGKIADKYSRKRLLMVSSILSAPFFALFVHSTNVFELFLFMFLSNAILGLSWPAFQALIIDYTPSTKWGLVNGISATTFWIGQMTGSMLSGALWDNFGRVIPYYVSALAIFLSTIPLLFLREKHSK